MTGVDDLIVREYFEMNGFFVRPLRKHNVQSLAKRSDQAMHFVIYSPNFEAESREPNPLLFSSELPLIERALVLVKGRHSPKFSAATRRSSAEIAKFLEKDILKHADSLFDLRDEDAKCVERFFKILVTPGFPTHEPHKAHSIEILDKAGIDAILSFRSMLQDIVSKVKVNYSYQRSNMLQILRLLKTYDMIKSSQLELFEDKK